MGMNDFLAMGGYGAYVWSSYAIFALALLVLPLYVPVLIFAAGACNAA
ncbi:MAG: heme exporter protein CcmD, partial [Dokdonella sp.]